MYQLAVTRDFIAQHYLFGGDWGKENQKHSHHYKIEVLIEAEQLDQHGYLIDIVDLDKALSELIETFQDRILNDLQDFENINPSLERFSRILWAALQEKLNLDKASLNIKLWENDNDWAAYRFSG